MKKTLLAVIAVFLAFAVSSCNQTSNDSVRTLFEENYIRVSDSEGLYGLMNKDLEMIVDYTYEEIHEFHNGLAIVKLDNHYGVMDSTGEIIVPISYDDIISHDDNINFRVHNNYEYAYFNNQGEEITIREYCENIGMEEDDLLVFFRRSADAYGFTDIDGNVVIQPIYGNIYHDYFSDYNFIRLAGQWGLIDSEGRLLIGPTFRRITPTNVDGLTNVFSNNLWGVMLDDGTYLYELQYEMEFLFTDFGLATAEKNGLYGIVKQDGEEFLPIEYESNNSTNKSLYQNRIISLVGDKNYLYDTEGEILYQTDLTINNFNSKFILMTDEETGMRFVKNYKDRTILEINNDNLYYFSNLDMDFIFKRQLVDEKICTIVYDEKGNIINPEGVYFNNITGSNYSNRTLIGFTSCGSVLGGFIDETGEWAIEPEYNFKYYYIYDDGYILINVDGLWGMLDMEGNLLLDFEYSSIGW